jgi:predicted HAD superfamily Cof-like phosphohydrolase
MSEWWRDVYNMHQKFGFHQTLESFTAEQLRQMLDFRIAFLKEELTELQENSRNAEEIVDACIDLIVVAIGTLDLFEVDLDKAWLEVHNANMSKQRGIKPGRPNPLGLPDLLKPEGWKAPSHEGNHGLLAFVRSDTVSGGELSLYG